MSRTDRFSFCCLAVAGLSAVVGFVSLIIITGGIA